MKKLLGVVILVGVVAVALWYVQSIKQNVQHVPPPVPVTVDYKNISYLIEGQNVTLIDGHAETAAVPGSASKIITNFFGNEATGDLNGDGMPDTAFLVTQSGGGSGTFYYVVVALKGPQGYQGTNAVLLGDRIAPQTTEIRDGRLIVNYAERRANEPMVTKPSVGVSMYLKIDGTNLVKE